MNENLKNIDFIPVKDLAGRKFIVKDYQRGYKWEREQIFALLSDIFYHTTGKYCLQPLIVKSEGESFELIDGQQRITSIYLLNYFLTGNKFCEIDYQTRESTKEFLNENLNLLNESLKITGDEFCRDNPTYDNVDVFHFFEVYDEIKKWFSIRTEEVKESIREKLNEIVHVIWYDVSDEKENQKAEDIFLNLNAGKVPLTYSELIKALFILDLKRELSPEAAKLKAFELANEWDRIENRLHENSFWYFLCDKDYYNQLPTRIDLIIDLTNKSVVHDPENDGKKSYEKYEELFRNGESLNWEKVQKTFFKLEEWYQNKEIYHYIGFLIVSGIRSLSSILLLSQNKNKENFKSSLKNLIKVELSRTREHNKNLVPVYDIDELDYSVNRKYCETILLLFNIEYFLSDPSDNRFPFDLYQKEKWSVEHINPQNPREFRDIQSLIEWLQSFKDYFESKEEDKILSSKIERILTLFEAVEDPSQNVSIVKLGQEYREVFSEIEDEITSKLELHKIGNLCLLDKNTNSKLGNKIFLSKRKDLLTLYYNSKEKDVFIPPGTKDVFTKNFSENELSITEKIFGFHDMEDYKTFIKKRLQAYYPNYETN